MADSARASATIPQSRRHLGVQWVRGGAVVDPVEDRGHPAALAVALDDVPEDKMALDIGPRSARLFAEEVERARTIFWNGPMGVFEIDAFAEGTEGVARAVARASAEGATSVIGGGDSVAAITQMGFDDDVSHVSTGGGAMLEFLEGQILPGVAALSDR